jgi:hypothetical protein
MAPRDERRVEASVGAGIFRMASDRAGSGRTLEAITM